MPDCCRSIVALSSAVSEEAAQHLCLHGNSGSRHQSAGAIGGNDFIAEGASGSDEADRRQFRASDVWTSGSTSV
jgi:hypothetical protein